MRRWKSVVVIFIILAVGVVVVLAYRHRGERLDGQAARAYHDGRPIESLALYRTVAQQYPSFLGDFARRAPRRVCELDDYLHAVELQDGGQVDEAIAAYESFLDEHCGYTPTNLYASFAREAVANLKLQQAQGLHDSGEHAMAFEAYQSVLVLKTIGGPHCKPDGEWDKSGAACQQADIVVEEGRVQAQASIPLLFLEWAKVLERQGDYAAAIEKYRTILQEYPDTPPAAQAKALAAETYDEWASQLREAADYAAAIEKYQTILQEYPDTPPVAQAKALAAETYDEWASQLREAADYAAAIEKHQTILQEYPDTPPAAQTKALAAETYGEWASQLRKAADYAAAIEKYETILQVYPGTPAAWEAQAALPATHYEWAAAARKAGDFAQALTHYEDGLTVEEVALAAAGVITVTSMQTFTATVTAESLDVLEGPDITYSVVGEAEKGDRLTVQGRNEAGDWLRIEKPEGWVASGLVELGVAEEQLPVVSEGRMSAVIEASVTAAQAWEDMAATLYEWGQDLSASQEYELALEKYQRILEAFAGSKVAGTTAREIGQTYNEWGEDLHGQREYAEAMEKFSLAQQVNDDPEVVVAAEESYSRALHALSQSTDETGRQLMARALNDVCEGKTEYENGSIPSGGEVLAWLPTVIR